MRRRSRKKGRGREDREELLSHQICHNFFSPAATIGVEVNPIIVHTNAGPFRLHWDTVGNFRCTLCSFPLSILSSLSPFIHVISALSLSLLPYPFAGNSINRTREVKEATATTTVPPNRGMLSSVAQKHNLQCRVGRCTQMNERTPGCTKGFHGK